MTEKQEVTDQVPFNTNSLILCPRDCTRFSAKFRFPFRRGSV